MPIFMGEYTVAVKSNYVKKDQFTGESRLVVVFGCMAISNDNFGTLTLKCVNFPCVVSYLAILYNIIVY